MAPDGRFESSAALEQEPERMPIAQYPVLATWARRQEMSMAESVDENECTLWLPVWSAEGDLGAAFRLEYAAPLDGETRSMIEGLLRIYTNHRQLIDYSERDSLTGLLNRKTFDTRFARMACQVSAHETAKLAQEERRGAGPVASHWLAVVDIDHFKKVNDSFGHLYGDEVLILIANILRASFRAQDRIFRFGGEEFVILLRSISLDSARRALERFRQQVEQHAFPQVGRVTVSIGFVAIGNDSPVVILGHADQALYYAKQHGRNQVRFYDELLQAGEVSQEPRNQTMELF
jgi:diguanylate cyclase (GGDEF)-like protein